MFCRVIMLLLLLCHLSESAPLPVEAIIIQIQQQGVVGAPHVTHQVLLNGVSLRSPSQEVKSLLKTMSAGALLPATISSSQASALKNHTIIRSRECIQEGRQFHWTDRVFYDGKVYLTLETNDTWTAHVPQAVGLKVVLDQEVERTEAEKIRLQEGCIQLMKELRLTEEQSGSSFPLRQTLIPVVAVLVLLVLIIGSFLISKKTGLRHPGGVIGSVIHYPNVTDAAELKGSGYSAL